MNVLAFIVDFATAKCHSTAQNLAPLKRKFLHRGVVEDELPGGIDGETSLDADDERGDVVIAESFPFFPFVGGSVHRSRRFDRVERALFQGAFKFVGSTGGKRDCYHLARDPHEQVDLYESSSELSGVLETLPADWVKSVSVGTESPEQFRVDPETLERLRSLGYG